MNKEPSLKVRILLVFVPSGLGSTACLSFACALYIRTRDHVLRLTQWPRLHLPLGTFLALTVSAFCPIARLHPHFP